MDRSWVGAKGSFKATDEKTRSAEPEILTSIFESIGACEETPAPGFYERVRGQIDQFERQSIWIPFIYSSLPMRLVTACFGVSFALLAYLFAALWNGNNAAYLVDGRGSMAISSPANVHQQRDAVLIQIATYDRAD
jgi:hypothetical protein